MSIAQSMVAFCSILVDYTPPWFKSAKKYSWHLKIKTIEAFKKHGSDKIDSLKEMYN